MAVRHNRRRRSGGDHFSLSLSGGEELADLARRLKSADKTLAKELRSGLLRAARPLHKGVRAEIPKVMPSGYAPVLSKSLQLRTLVRTSRYAHVTIVASAKGLRDNRRIRPLDKGILRHPLFGDREWWYTTRVRPGFWSRPMRAGVTPVRRELIKVMSDVKAKITKG